MRTKDTTLQTTTATTTKRQITVYVDTVTKSFSFTDMTGGLKKLRLKCLKGISTGVAA